MMKPFALSTILIALAGAPSAHPHIFVDTGMELRFDPSGKLSEVVVTWQYDEFYSLLITEDRGLDPDYDGILTEAEIASLAGFDMQWIGGFNGDLVIEQDGRVLTLSGPIAPTATFADGRITTTHIRRLDQDEVSGAALQIKPYDPTYYTAYDVTLPVVIDGPDVCNRRIDVPDIDARLREMRDILDALDADATPEDEGLPDIGGLLATTVTVSCDMS